MLAMTKFEIGKTILIILVLNIILPTADVATDLKFIEELFRGVAGCFQTEKIKSYFEADVEGKCRHVGVIYTGRHPELCSQYRNWSSEYENLLKCRRNGSDNYCSDPASNKNVCSASHPNMATAMLIPFCLNYIFCFIAFFRLGTDKKKTFIFPLLNLYPQFGIILS